LKKENENKNKNWVTVDFYNISFLPMTAIDPISSL
jgi:hypothetical protein